MYRQTIAMCSTVFHIVCSFVMFVVDVIGEHIVEAYSSIGIVSVTGLRAISPYDTTSDRSCVCPSIDIVLIALLSMG